MQPQFCMLPENLDAATGPTPLRSWPRPAQVVYRLLGSACMLSTARLRACAMRTRKFTTLHATSSCGCDNRHLGDILGQPCRDLAVPVHVVKASRTRVLKLDCFVTRREDSGLTAVEAMRARMRPSSIKRLVSSNRDQSGSCSLHGSNHCLICPRLVT